MMPSRGMGDIRASKMPKRKSVKGRTETSSPNIKKVERSSLVSTRLVTTPNPVFASQFLSGSKQVVKAVPQGNGAPVRHKCWLSSIRKLAGVTKIEGSSKKPEELD
jgi:hypothetical protein